jgi:hypothetical protein
MADLGILGENPYGLPLHEPELVRALVRAHELPRHVLA